MTKSERLREVVEQFDRDVIEAWKTYDRRCAEIEEEEGERMSEVGANGSETEPKVERANKEGAPALSELEQAWVCGYAYGYAVGGGDFDFEKSLPERLRAPASKVYQSTYALLLRRLTKADAVGCDLFPEAKE